MSLQAQYDCRKRNFSQDCHQDPDECLCRSGWILSPFDTWHKCPVHFDGQRHPEDPVFIKASVDEFEKPGGEKVFLSRLTVEGQAFLLEREFSTREEAQKAGEDLASHVVNKKDLDNEDWTCVSEPGECDLR